VLFFFFFFFASSQNPLLAIVLSTSLAILHMDQFYKNGGVTDNLSTANRCLQFPSCTSFPLQQLKFQYFILVISRLLGLPYNTGGGAD
jgi:hypothetical protein